MAPTYSRLKRKSFTLFADPLLWHPETSADKSSCFSAEALLGEEAFAASKDAGREWKGGDVIDACAAPGNKTMHAASLLSQLPPPSASKEDRPKATVFGRCVTLCLFSMVRDLNEFVRWTVTLMLDGYAELDVPLRSTTVPR